MKIVVIGALTLAFGAACGGAQSLDSLNIQVHGYATQGFLYTTNNNILTTNSSNGSPAWTEAVINISSQPIPKLRVTVQGRYFLLGNYGNTITLDYGAADYKVNDRFGVRFGKVKVPSGLFNETQDIDPSYSFALLPQGQYSIASRNSVLSLYGGVAYGTLDLPPFGKLEYRGWGGVRSITGDDGNFLAQREAGTVLPFGFSGTAAGAAIHWKLPIDGLMIGASDTHSESKTAPVVNTPTNGAAVTATNGTETVPAFSQVAVFGKYEHNKLMLASEYYKSAAIQLVTLTGKPTTRNNNFHNAWYVMATYKPIDKLTAGAYSSQDFNRSAALGPARYSKVLVISGRYDFNQYLYAKLQEQFIEGTMFGFDKNLNPNPKPNTKLTILKIGVSF